MTVFRKQYKFMHPFLIQQKMRATLTLAFSVMSKAVINRGSYIIHGILKHLNEKRQIMLTLSAYFTRICLIQSRARLQISLFKKVQSDFFRRLQVNIDCLCNRFIEQAALKKKYPNFIN